MIAKRMGTSLAIGMLLLLVARSLAAVEVIPDSPVARDHLITVRSTGYVWVIGIVNGQFATVDTHRCDGALVFCGPPGSYLVYGVEHDQQFQQVVQIVGEEVNPDPPLPPEPDPPGPEPDPEPLPIPDGMENLYGIGEVAYRSAMQPGTVEDVGRLAEQYERAARFLHEQRLTPETAQKQLRAVRAELSGDWSTWESEVETAVQKAVDRYGSGQMAWRDYCREIGGGLRSAWQARGGR